MVDATGGAQDNRILGDHNWGDSHQKAGEGNQWMGANALEMLDKRFGGDDLLDPSEMRMLIGELEGSPALQQLHQELTRKSQSETGNFSMEEIKDLFSKFHPALNAGGGGGGNGKVFDGY